jgi:benzodiazapine receptor
MTTYIPLLTLPDAVFRHPAASILLPIALGTAVGFGTRRKFYIEYLGHSSLM